MRVSLSGVFMLSCVASLWQCKSNARAKINAATNRSAMTVSVSNMVEMSL